MLTATLTALVRQSRAREEFMPARLLLAALIVFAVAMLFSFPLHRPTRATTFWTLLGLSWAFLNHRSSMDAAAPPHKHA